MEDLIHTKAPTLPSDT